MAILKIKNEHGTWDDIPALRGRDGAIQYTAGANIEISSDNVISARGLENTVTREDVTEMINEAVPTDVSDLTNDAGYVTSADIPTDVSDLNNDAGYVTANDIPTKTSDLINDGMGDSRGLYGYAAVYPRDSRYPWGISIEGSGTTQNPFIIKPIIADVVVNKPLAFKDEIPTALSSLTNDAGFITSAAVPTKTSDLINDAGFVPMTSVPVNLSDLNNDTNYAESTELNISVSDVNVWHVTASDTRITFDRISMSETDKKVLMNAINEVINPTDIPTSYTTSVKVYLNKTIYFNIHLPENAYIDGVGNVSLTGSEIYNAGFYGMSRLLKVAVSSFILRGGRIDTGLNPTVLSIGSGSNFSDVPINFPIFSVGFSDTTDSVSGITAITNITLNDLQKNKPYNIYSNTLRISKEFEDRRLIHTDRGVQWASNKRYIKPTELTNYATNSTLKSILDNILKSHAGSLYGESIILKDSDLDTNFKNIVLTVYDGSEVISVYNTYGGVTYYTHTATIKLYDKYPKSGESVYELIIEFTWNDYSYYVDSITSVTNNGWITVS